MKNIRLGIESLYVSNSYVTGIERYLQLALESLTSIHSDWIDEIVVFANENFTNPNFSGDKIRIVRTRHENFEITVENEKIDLLHCTFIPPARRLSCPILYTLHDAGRYIFPNLMDRKVTDEHSRRLSQLLEIGNCALLTVSGSSKAEICKELAISSSLVHVATLFVSDKILLRRDEKSENDNFALASLGISKPYMMTAGCFSPTKNIAKLTQAYQNIPAPKPDLVVIGRDGWDYEGQSLMANTKGIIRLKNISDSNLTALYRNCLRYVSASLIEGFGLPVLEAAFFGSPISCSDIGAYREILGTKAFFFNPDNINEIQQGLCKYESRPVLYDDEIRLFTKEKMGKELVEAYKSIV